MKIRTIAALLFLAFVAQGFVSFQPAGGEACLDAAISTLLQQLHGTAYENASFQTLDSGQPGRGGKSYVYIGWDANGQSYWLKGNIWVAQTCIQATWETTEHSPNLAGAQIPASFNVAGYEQAKGMGLGKRPSHTPVRSARGE